MKIYYTIHEEGCIDVVEDEEHKTIMEDYKNNIQGFALAEITDRTRYYNKENITITIEK